MAENFIDVVAAVIMRDGKVLLSSRPGAPPPDNWEFPGGKVEPGESRAAALERELREECGMEVMVFDKLHEECLPKGGKTLRLHFMRVLPLNDDAPQPLDGQEFRTVPLARIEEAGLLAADRHFAARLRMLDGDI